MSDTFDSIVSNAVEADVKEFEEKTAEKTRERQLKTKNMLCDILHIDFDTLDKIGEGYFAGFSIEGICFSAIDSDDFGECLHATGCYSCGHSFSRFVISAIDVKLVIAMSRSMCKECSKPNLYKSMEKMMKEFLGQS